LPAVRRLATTWNEKYLSAIQSNNVVVRNVEGERKALRKRN